MKEKKKYELRDMDQINIPGMQASTCESTAIRKRSCLFNCKKDWVTSSAKRGGAGGEGG